MWSIGRAVFHGRMLQKAGYSHVQKEKDFMSAGYLIDMDGVIYRGSELIPGARQFIVKLLDEDVPNSIESPFSGKARSKI